MATRGVTQKVDGTKYLPTNVCAGSPGHYHPTKLDSCPRANNNIHMSIRCGLGMRSGRHCERPDWAHAAFAQESAAFRSMDSASSAPSLVRLPPLSGPHPRWMCRHKSGWVQQLETSKRHGIESKKKEEENFD
jgi:hypothetical protein